MDSKHFWINETENLAESAKFVFNHVCFVVFDKTSSNKDKSAKMTVYRSLETDKGE